MGIPVLVELISSSSPIPVDEVLTTGTDVSTLSREQLKLSEFAQGFLAHTGEDPRRCEQLLDEVIDVACLPRSGRHMILDACFTLLQEVCARFPEVDREMKTDVPSVIPFQDAPDDFALLPNMFVDRTVYF
jgi:hypothetical protein